MSDKSVWETLSRIDCSTKTKKVNNKFTYLSWVWAWGIAKENYPDTTYKVVDFDGKPYCFDENLGYLVQTEVTIRGETLCMSLPVLDGANKAQKHIEYAYKTKYDDKTCAAASMFDINTAIMRCLTKNLALFGLGHYIYAGEDLPQETVEPVSDKQLVTINELIVATDTDVPLFLEWLKVKTLKDLNDNSAKHAIKALNAKLKKQPKGDKK